MAVENPAARKIRWTVGWEGEEALTWVDRNGDFLPEPGMIHDRFSPPFISRAVFQTSLTDQLVRRFPDE